MSPVPWSRAPNVPLTGLPGAQSTALTIIAGSHWHRVKSQLHLLFGCFGALPIPQRGPHTGLACREKKGQKPLYYRTTGLSGLEGTFKDPLVHPLTRQGHLEQVTQECFQLGFEFECLHRGRLHDLPVQPVPGLCHPQREEFLPHAVVKLLVL